MMEFSTELDLMQVTLTRIFLTEPKVHALCNENIDIHFFPLYDAIDFQVQSNTK
jgi:hypothetical protein